MKQFRSELYQSFAHHADALMELIDALSSTTTARSVVEVSLEACFRRQYSSVYAAIDKFFQITDASKAAEERREQEQRLLALIARQITVPEKQSYWFSAQMRLQRRVYFLAHWKTAASFTSSPTEQAQGQQTGGHRAPVLDPGTPA